MFSGRTVFPGLIALSAITSTILLVWLIISGVKNSRSEQLTLRQLEQANAVQSAVRSLPHNYFSFDTIENRFILLQHIRFGQGSDYMVADDRKFLYEAGTTIQQAVKKLPIDSLQKGQTTVLVDAVVPGYAHPATLALAWKRAYAIQAWWQQSGALPGKAVCKVKATATVLAGLQVPRAKWGIEQQGIHIYIIPAFH